MEINVYSMFDSAAQAFTQPFFLQNDGLAIRAFQDNINSPEPNNVSEHPDQFTLFRIAEYNDKTGIIDKLEKPISLGIGVTFKNDPPINNSELEGLKARIEEVNKAVQILVKASLDK